MRARPWNAVHWSLADHSYIRANYPTLGSRPCAAHLRCTPEQVNQQARMLGVRYLFPRDRLGAQ